MNVYAAAKQFIYGIFGSPERDRLAGAIKETELELGQQTAGSDPAQLNEQWARAAHDFLAQSNRYLEAWNTQQGWISLLSAHRAILSNPRNEDAVERAAIALRREADKVTGWRAKVIEDLVCNSKRELREDIQMRPLSPHVRHRIISAIAHRDDQFHTTYFKIILRRRHLFQLFIVIWIGVALCLLLASWGRLPAPLDDVKMIAAVILFGVLGASLSVGQGLLAADVSAKIPAQQIGAFVVWMRPGIGAAAALVAFVLIHAKFFGFDPTNTSVVLAVAFAAGFSERFIVGAIETLTQTTGKSGSS